MRHWLRRLLPLNSHDAEMELNKVQRQIKHIQNLATALVKAESTSALAEIIADQCRAALTSDAICLYLLRPQGYYEMIAERGCTQRFKEEWLRLYPEKIPLLRPATFNQPYFFGSPEDFKRHIPNSDELVDNSKRKMIGYSPLIVHDKAIGLLGFSYNTEVKYVDRQFIMTLSHLCAEALERVRLFDLERQIRQEAQDANRAKTEFLTSISHEIRAPINAIQGFADLIYKSGELSPRHLAWVERILKNTQHLAALIGDVLDISKIEADKIDVCNNVFSLADLVEDVKAVTSFKADEKAISLNFTYPRMELCTDAVHVRQILINLVGNAIKFTPAHGRVEVQISFNDGKLRIDVRDTGPGIAPENQHLIFKPFVQVGPGDHSRMGTGLGLFISKRLARALGGDCRLEKSTPEGSWFVAEIRCAPARGKKINRFLQRNGSLKGLNFLLVDDSEDNRDLVKYLLSQEGANVDTAENGHVGIEKALLQDYEVVIMDIKMPGLDGNQAVSRLRAAGYKKPIVALTAEVMAHQREESLQRGFDDYLCKPINTENLIHTLKRLAH